MKSKIVIAVILSAILLVTAFVFINSSKNNEASHENSDLIVHFIEPIIEFFVKDYSSEDFETLSLTVRKIAHVVEFGALGAAVMFLIDQINKRYGKSLYGFGFFFILLVAVTDEYIQSFSNRHSMVRDVYLDLAGALIGFAVVWILGMVVDRLRRVRVVR